ncbi:hypothetical protein HYX13_05010, partial [Candidatus Woesearchaeota archaeon]|nr:hypothetical protein [Candidatus Woesearchaeota archaeon]
QKKEQDKAFLKEAFKRYRLTKKFLLRDFDADNKQGASNVTNRIVQHLNTVHLELNSVKLNSGEKTILRLSEHLGAAFGGFMAVVEYGFTSPVFRQELASLSQKEIDGSFLRSIQEMRISINQLNKNINQNFIKRRVEIIAKKHGSEFSQQQKVFFAKIAAIFAK